MSNKSRRGPKIPPRPQILNEQLRNSLSQSLGAGPRTLNREQSMFVVTGLAANLEKLLCGDDRMPFVQASIEKRSDGFSLHVQIVEPSGSDAEVVG